MTTLVKCRLWFTLILVLSFRFCFAQAPSGPVTLSFGSPSTAVYDLSGTYTIEQSFQGAGGTPVPITLVEMPLIHDGQGRLSGRGTIMVTIGDTSAVAANYIATGRVSGGGGNRANRVTLSIRLTGRDVIAGLDRKFSISIHYSLEVDPGTLSLIGTSRGRANIAGGLSGNIKSDVFVPLPVGVNGSWSAQMDILPLHGLGGSANIVLSNGRALPTKLTGSYSGNSGLARVRLAGRSVPYFYNYRGNQLSLSFFPGANQPERVTGKILGQTVRQ